MNLCFHYNNIYKMSFDSESSMNYQKISNKEKKRNEDTHKQDIDQIKSPKINYLSAKFIKFVRK